MPAKIWHAAARLLVAPRGSKKRREANRALDTLRRGAKTKVAGLAQGLALLKIGDKTARTRLRDSTKDITDDQPNPLLYRARTALATLAKQSGDLKEARVQVDKAIALNPGFLPAYVLSGRLYMLEPGKNLAEARTALLRASDAGLSDPAAQLALAEVLVSGRRVSKEDRQKARDALERAIEAGAAGAELGRVTALVGP